MHCIGDVRLSIYYEKVFREWQRGQCEGAKCPGWEKTFETIPNFV